MDCQLLPGAKMIFGTVYRILDNGIHDKFSIESLFANKRVLVFGGPAPFSKLDTQQAIEYAGLGADILKHVDVIYGIYCQDAFVMKKFAEHVEQAVPNSPVVFYGDGDAFFIKNHQLEHDFTFQGLGIRSGRYAFVVKNHIIEHVALDEYQLIENTSAEELLKWLKSN